MICEMYFNNTLLDMNLMNLVIGCSQWGDSDMLIGLLTSEYRCGAWGVLVLLKFQVNSQKLGVQASQNLEFE